MGLFSFFGKNKQGRAAEDSGRFYSKDDDAALGERARSKRASSAGAVAGSTRGRGTGNDPMLPEKKRARRRLVGAIALALAAAVGLPMLLDSEPKPLAGDIAIQIPPKDKAAPLPVPAEPSAAPAAVPVDTRSAVPAAARSVKAVAAEDSVDKGEEVLQAPPAAKPAAKPEHKPEPLKAKAEPKPEHKPEHKPEPKPEHKLADKPEPKAEKADKPAKPKTEDKPAKPHDDVRALAILEGKAADKAEKEKSAESSSQRFVLQVAALSSQDKAAELQAKLRGAGISSHTEKAGELIKVKVGPLNKDEAEKVRAKLGRIGLSGFMTPV
jgi:DedD protein